MPPAILSTITISDWQLLWHRAEYMCQDRSVGKKNMLLLRYTCSLLRSLGHMLLSHKVSELAHVRVHP